VIGVVCSSFGALDDQEHVSYASLIAGALLIAIENLEDGGTVKKTLLYDLAKLGHIAVDQSLNDIAIRRIDDHVELSIGRISREG
jgi:hypothetical protein